MKASTSMVFKPLKSILKTFKSTSTKTQIDGSSEPVKDETGKNLDISNTTNSTAHPESIEFHRKSEASSCTAETNERVAVAKEYISCFNEKRLQDVTDNLITKDLIYEFYDVSRKHIQQEMRWSLLAEEAEKIFLSFPDFCFVYKMLNDDTNNNNDDDTLSEKDPVKVLVVVSGTHTGAPYAFGPYQPVDPSGKKVVNDPEEIHFFFRGDKVCKIEVYPRGESFGPAGIYVQAGGFPL